jgi:hypothetical protein
MIKTTKKVAYFPITLLAMAKTLLATIQVAFAKLHILRSYFSVPLLVMS